MYEEERDMRQGGRMTKRQRERERERERKAIKRE